MGAATDMARMGCARRLLGRGASGLYLVSASPADRRISNLHSRDYFDIRIRLLAHRRAAPMALGQVSLSRLTSSVSENDFSHNA